MQITDTQADNVKKILASLPMVNWDRYCENDLDRDIIIYGWIDRDGDAYKDFVVLTLWLPRLISSPDEVDVISFTTSSAKYTREISKILFDNDDNHNDCKRVEDQFEVPNCIRL